MKRPIRLTIAQASAIDTSGVSFTARADDVETVFILSDVEAVELGEEETIRAMEERRP